MCVRVTVLLCEHKWVTLSQLEVDSVLPLAACVSTWDAFGTFSVDVTVSRGRKHPRSFSGISCSCVFISDLHKVPFLLENDCFHSKCNKLM